MNNIGFNVNECRIGLQSYADEIDELMELVKEVNSMKPDQIEKAKELLANLKSCLKQDCKLRDTNKGREKMSDVEAAIYAPAVHQALVDLGITSNSRPNKEWFSKLYGIQITIRHALESLGEWHT